MSTSLNPDQDRRSVGPEDRRSVGPDLGPNCLQMLSVICLQVQHDHVLKKVNLASRCLPVDKITAWSFRWGSKVNYLNFEITKSVVNILPKFHMQTEVQ